MDANSPDQSPSPAAVSDADLVVQAYGSKIETLNPRGCGVSGYQIQVPIAALTSNESLNEDLTLALTNYKYGLFMDNITELEIPRNNSTQQKISEKQDLLCEGRYPADVIIDNNSWKQFAANNSNTTNNYTQPQFVLATRAQTHHYVLVLDQSNRMEFNLRWRNIKRSLNRFIANLQEGTMISIVTCAAEGSLVLPPTVVTAANREGIHGRIPRRTEDVSVACISCGLRLAQDVLTGSAAGTVLLITGSNENDKVEDFTISGGKLFSILYPGLYSSAISSGAVYSIQEDTARSPVAQLNEVIIDIVSKVDNSRQLVKIHEASYQAFEFSGTFQLGTGHQDAIVTLIVENEESVEYFEVMDPSNEKNIFPKYEDGSVQVHLAGKTKPGIWSYHAKLYSDSSFAMHRMSVDVIVKYTDEAIDNHVMLSGLSLAAPVEDLSKPVAVLAKLYLGEAPVLSGHVKAFITGPDTDSEILLVDGHYPDVAKGDGIYTGYVTKFSTQPGYYTVRLAADDNNGLASVVSTETDSLGPTGTFTRFVSATSFYVSTGVPQGHDIIPPSRIIDLAITEQYDPIDSVKEDNNLTTTSDNLFDNETITVNLQFTSPGDDYNMGQAQSYEIRCHTSPEALSTQNFPSDGLVIPLENKPEPAGNLEVVQVPVPWIGETWYYGIVAIDNAGNRGKISNLAAVFIPLPEQPDYEDSALGHNDYNLHLRSPSWLLDTEYMYIIGGCVAGAILCVMLIVAFLIHKSRRGGKSAYIPDDDTYESGFQPTENGVNGSPHAKIADKTETESGIYSWLESLPRSEASGKAAMPAMGLNAAAARSHGLLMSAGSLPKRGNINNCEEVSNNSRPTTSTDDSISESGGEASTAVDGGSQQTVGSGAGHINPVWEDNMSQDDYASQVLARSFQYYSGATNSNSRPRGQQVYTQQHQSLPVTVMDPSVPVPVHHMASNGHYQQNQFTSPATADHFNGQYTDASRASFYRKKRHESVV